MSKDNRQYALGQELNVTVLTRGAETDGRHDLAAEFGDVILGPPGMTPAQAQAQSPA